MTLHDSTIGPWVTINISTPLADTVPLFSMDSSTVTWSEAEHCKAIAAKECLCPFSPSQASKCNVYAHPPGYVNNSEVMQGIVLAALVSGSEKLSARRRRIFHFLIPVFTKQYT